MANLRLTKDDIVTELCTGAFRGMNMNDRATFADAGEHCLIAFIKRGNHEYAVIFDAELAECEINLGGGGTGAWLMNMENGQTVVM